MISFRDVGRDCCCIASVAEKTLLRLCSPTWRPHFPRASPGSSTDTWVSVPPFHLSRDLWQPNGEFLTKPLLVYITEVPFIWWIFNISRTFISGILHAQENSIPNLYSVFYYTNSHIHIYSDSDKIKKSEISNVLPSETMMRRWLWKRLPRWLRLGSDGGNGGSGGSCYGSIIAVVVGDSGLDSTENEAAKCSQGCGGSSSYT